MNESVNTIIHNNIAEIIFYNPKGNSLTSDILKELKTAFDFLAKNDDVKLIVLKSYGSGAFCGGASLNEFLSIKDLKCAENYFQNFADLFQSMILCSKFIIARVHGKAVGGGVGLISACDYVISSNMADIRLSELAIGIGPFVISPLVEKRIGNSAFKSLTINYEWHSAKWAFDKGLYDELTEINELDERIKLLTDKLVLGSSEAMENLKKIFWNDQNKIFALLEERVLISAKLLLSSHTQKYLKNIFNN